MHNRLVDATRINVVVQLEGRPERHAGHRYGQRDQIPVPHLELLVAAGHELRPGYIADDEDLQALALVGKRQRLVPGQLPLGR